MGKEYTKRSIRLIFGLFLYGVGSYMGIQANVGLAPWEAFSMGIFYKTGMLYGDIVVLTGVVIIVIDFLLKEKIGFGTVLNAIMIGKVVDLCNWLDFIPKMENFAAGVAVLLAGQVVICVASYFYIGAGLGCGPRDAGSHGKETEKISYRTGKRYSGGNRSSDWMAAGSQGGHRNCDSRVRHRHHNGIYFQDPAL